ncbi:DMT family transporter [Treponema parvum]|uniref:DMT family transporter n=1 Tax=Treponema parvum TaxID=138851 RepID=A0A975EY68_9SPIR|nr:DMT family transporter [Treponema parvum]QTQ11150.1 DMT family transporter [Treponema parvum]QTQ16909.1 DMT family transporter [Treponema parvum]
MIDKAETPFFQRTVVVFLCAAICCAFWGSSVPCIKGGYALFSIGAGDIPARILFAGVRFIIAGILTILSGSVGAKKILFPTDKSSWIRVFVLCAFQTVLQYFFLYGGLAHTLGVKSAIIGATNVFASILVASLIFRQEKLTLRKITGCLIGFCGVVILNLLGTSGISQTDLSFKFIGEGFLFLSAIAHGVAAAFLKGFSKNDNPVMLSGWQFFFGGLIMAAAGYFTGGRMIVADGRVFAAVSLLIYMALISTVAYSLWGILLKYNHVSKVVIFGFLNPVFGVIFSAVFLNEANSTGSVAIISLLLVCIGIIVVSKGKN